MKFKNIKQESLIRFSKSIDLKTVYTEFPTYKEPRIIQDWIVWLEQRPNEGGRNTILIRPWGDLNTCPKELTPFPINVKSRINGYGGAPFAIEIWEDELFITWMDDTNRCLWFQTWNGLKNCQNNIQANLKVKSKSRCLSTKDASYTADGLLDLKRNRWIGVMEKENKDYLISYSLNHENQSPKILYESSDFLGYVVLNQAQDKIAWVEWQRPYMPWDSSQLKVATFDNLGELSNDSALEVSLSEKSCNYSIFQPFWLEEEKLLVISDIDGWWTPKIIQFDYHIKSKYTVQNILSLDVEVEFALPQWVRGMSNIAFNKDNIFLLGCSSALWKLYSIDHKGFLKEILLPFENLSNLTVHKDRILMIGGNSLTESGLIEIDLKADSCHYQSSRNISFNPEDISVGQPFLFKGFNGEITHSWHYSPRDTKGALPPLLVKVHSGPTSMSERGLDLEVQFWTSRGWSVLDVNYGGSTGFGRSYRERLKDNWGIVDSFDCIAGAKALIKLGKVNKNLIAIFGSSAGGFTALNSVILSDVFSIAACKYPVTDLCDMKKNTHRFEQGYLDSLIGSFEQNQDLYIKRSPIHNASHIKVPVIFFQGLKDQVVSPDKTYEMYKLLQSQGLPSEIYTFPDEGHSFAQRQNKINVLSKIEEFFNKHLDIN